MCLAVPAEIVEIRPGDKAIADIGGVRQEISLGLVENVAVGDYVIVHVGFALQRLDAADAQETLDLFARMASAASGGAAAE